MKIRTCSKCQATLPANEKYFSPDTTGSDGLYSYCRECGRRANRARAKKLKSPTTLETQQEEKYNDLLGLRKCPDCKTTIPLDSASFAPNTHRANGFNCYCRACTSTRTKIAFAAKQEKKREALGLPIVPDSMKLCQTCDKIFPKTTEFFHKRKNGFKGKCKNCTKIANVKRYKENTAHIQKTTAQWRTANRNTVNATARKRRITHPEATQAQDRATYERDRLTILLRKRVQKAIKYRYESSKKLLGANISVVWRHLEHTVLVPVSVKNFSETFSIDHVVPCNAFDLGNHEEQLLCFNYKNLQLLPHTVNMSKGARSLTSGVTTMPPCDC